MKGMPYFDKNRIKIYNMLEGRNFRRALWGYHPTFQNIDIITT